MASSSMKLPPGATLEGNDGSMPLPPGATLVNDQSNSTPNAADQNQNKELPPTKVGTMPRAGEVWSAINEPLIPEGKAEKEGHEIAESAPSRWDEAHPTLSGIEKGVAGAYADTQGFIRGLTSPLGVATLGLGEVGETPGALGRIAKVGSRIAGAGFGAQGAEQTAEGVKDIATNGITPENTNKTLSGLGSVALGGAAAVHGTKVGNAPINPETVTKIAAAPIRAVANKIPTSPVAMKEFGLPGHERTARTLVGNDFVPKATAPVPVAPSPSPLAVLPMENQHQTERLDWSAVITLKARRLLRPPKNLTP